VEAIYSDLEQLGVTSPNNDYEELPGADAGTSPVPYDYSSTQLGADLPRALDSDNYDIIDGARGGGVSPLSPTSPGILYAVVDRNATEVNGDIYATVNKGGEDPVYTLLPNEGGGADNGDKDDPKYAALGSLPRMTILVSESQYARLPGEEGDYASLPEAGSNPGDAPSIPERRYVCCLKARVNCCNSLRVGIATTLRA
jgi:hypothetical protein